MKKYYYIFPPVIIIILVLVIISYFIINNNMKKKILNNKIAAGILNNENNYFIPKIIWVYWNNTSTLPVSILNTLRNNLSVLREWKIIFLDEITVHKYIPLDIMPCFKGLQPAQKADWIRLYLIDIYGGCWCDAGIIINIESALDKLREDSILKKSLFTGFYFESRVVNNDVFSFIECWFILAPKNSILIHLWRLEFERALNMGLMKYKKKLIRSKELNLTQMYKYDNDDTYLTVQTCLYNLSNGKLNEYILNHMILHRAEESMFLIQHICKWDRKCIHSILNDDRDVKRVPFIKLVTNDRKDFNLDKYHLL